MSALHNSRAVAVGLGFVVGGLSLGYNRLCFSLCNNAFPNQEIQKLLKDDHWVVTTHVHEAPPLQALIW